MSKLCWCKDSRSWGSSEHKYEMKSCSVVVMAKKQKAKK